MSDTREMLVDQKLRSRVRRRLRSWFRRRRRPLPWRRNRDPYRIWVSEVMLQQTQVATVIGYFKRFVHAFPTLKALAAASTEELLRHWEGLGYYRRAHDLHQAARRLVSQHGGRFPEDLQTWLQLPGIGRYTAGAILSQAFDQRLPILEANSRRLLCRFFGRTDDPQRGSGQRWLWQAAEELLPARHSGEFNQSLMELGALVCTPKAPHCSDCPLAEDCRARRLQLQESIPARASPARIIAVQEVAVVVRCGVRVLLVQRPKYGRWAGLWEFPHGPLAGREAHQAAAARNLEYLTGLRTQLGPKFLTLRHALTRHRITMTCYLARYRSGRFRSPFYQQGRWLEPDRLEDYPVSAPQRRLARAFLASLSTWT